MSLSPRRAVQSQNSLPWKNKGGFDAAFYPHFSINDKDKSCNFYGILDEKSEKDPSLHAESDDLEMNNNCLIF